MTIPIYRLIVEDELADGPLAVALVDMPAIGVNWVTMSGQSIKRYSFDAEKRTIFGPVMIPDILIYREKQDGQPYYVTYTKDDIKKSFDAINRRGKVSLNLNHVGHAGVNDAAFVTTNYIKDAELGLSAPAPFDALPDGTWFMSAKITDPELWERCKSGELKGFSIEGFFSEMELGEMTPKEIKRQNDIILPGDKINSQLSFTKMFNIFKKSNRYKFAEYVTKTGETLSIEGEVSEGAIVSKPDGSPVENGDYQLENDTIITVEDSVIVSIIAAETEEIVSIDTEALLAAISALKDEVSKVSVGLAAFKAEQQKAADQLDTIKTELSQVKARAEEAKSKADEVAKQPESETVKTKTEVNLSVVKNPQAEATLRELERIKKTRKNK